jgi:hypothetical protein
MFTASVRQLSNSSQIIPEQLNGKTDRRGDPENVETVA